MASQLRWTTEDQDQQGQLFSSDDAMDRRKGVGEFRGMEFLHVRAKRIVNEVPRQSRMPFRFTINAYRGCSHACVYCFARPTHSYLGLDIAKDFDTKIVVKVNAVERLRAELSDDRWLGDSIAMGTNTDPYQRAEGKYRLTRGLIEVLAEHRNPFSILTKSTLITRDIDVLVAASKRTDVQLTFSIPTLDSKVWKETEPGTPHPGQRVAAIRRFADAGLGVGVLAAPLLPGLSDSPEQLAEVVDSCVQAGAQWVAASPLHLKPGLKEHWLEWLGHAHPELLPKYSQLYAGRAYLTKSEQEATTAMTRQAVIESRDRHGPGPANAKNVHRKSQGANKGQGEISRKQPTRRVFDQRNLFSPEGDAQNSAI